MASLSRQLAQWVVSLRYDDLPPAVVDRAKGVTLHSLASVLLGSQLPSGQQAVKLVTDEEAGVRRGATIMVDGTVVTKGGAAFANSEMAMAGGKLDSFRMLTHPGTSIVPGAFVAAETADASGRDFLTGLAVGSEGTFGVVTAITVRLLHQVEAVKTALASFGSLEIAAEAVSAIIAAGMTPAALEMLDAVMIGAINAGVGAGFPEGAGAVLLIELDGPRAEVETQSERIAAICRERGALFLDPRQTADTLELLREPPFEREQVQHVRLGVAALSFRERATRPIVALARRRQFHAEVGPEQHVEAQRLGAEEARSDRGIE